jgi:hypothetical protein
MLSSSWPHHLTPRAQPLTHFMSSAAACLIIRTSTSLHSLATANPPLPTPPRHPMPHVTQSLAVGLPHPPPSRTTSAPSPRPTPADWPASNPSSPHLQRPRLADRILFRKTVPGSRADWRSASHAPIYCGQTSFLRTTSLPRNFDDLGACRPPVDGLAEAVPLY